MHGLHRGFNDGNAGLTGIFTDLIRSLLAAGNDNACHMHIDHDLHLRFTGRKNDNIISELVVLGNFIAFQRDDMHMPVAVEILFVHDYRTADGTGNVGK